MSPKVSEEGLIDYTDLERLNMHTNGVCVTCDDRHICVMQRDIHRFTDGWGEKGETIKVKVEHCSLHKVQGIKTFGIRGK